MGFSIATEIVLLKVNVDRYIPDKGQTTVKTMETCVTAARTTSEESELLGKVSRAVHV